MALIGAITWDLRVGSRVNSYWRGYLELGFVVIKSHFCGSWSLGFIVAPSN